MKKSIFLASAALTAIAAFSAIPALAGTHWSVNVGVGGFYPPVVYAPAPYYAPPPVVAPAPVYVQPVYPQPVYVQPYVYGGSYYSGPSYVAPPPVYYYRGGYRYYHDYRR